MKEILTTLKSLISAGLPEIKGVHILADADILPPAVRFPCVGLKDGDSSYSEGMAETEDEKGSVLIYVYQQILKQEASVMGDGTQKGILEFIKTLRLLINFNHLGGLVHHAYCPEVFASETMFAGENIFVQRKGIRYIYEIDPEAFLSEPISPILGPELIINGEMEVGDPPTGWSVISDSSQERSSDQAHRGTYSNLITAGILGDVGIVPAGGEFVTGLTIGHTYKVTAWFRGLDLIDDSFRLYGGGNEATLPVSNGSWVKLEVNFVAENIETTIGAYIFIASNTGKKFYVDDVSVKEIL